MTRLSTAIQTAVWAMRPQEMFANMGVAMRIVNGDYPIQQAQPKPLLYALQSGLVVEANQLSESKQPQEATTVAYYDISGTITKADQECGPRGTVSLMRRMLANDRDPSVVGHFAEIDSGGGEATNVEEVARFIRYELKKPTVAHFNGLMCSAAQGIGAAFDECYATLPTDICGSVGVFMTFADWKAYYEKQGLKIQEVYADPSVLKNDDFTKAMEGDFEPIKKNLLNPFAENFIALIKELRPATTGHDDIFKGKTYMAIEARDNGLIDGMMTQQQAINRVFELATQSKSNQSKSNQSTKMTIFGIEIGSVTKAENGEVTLTEEQYAKLTADSQANDANEMAIETLKGELEKERQNNTQLAEKFMAVLARVEVLEAQPATVPAQANGVTEPKTEKVWEKFNKSIQEDMQTGKRLFQ